MEKNNIPVSIILDKAAEQISKELADLDIKKASSDKIEQLLDKFLDSIFKNEVHRKEWHSKIGLHKKDEVWFTFHFYHYPLAQSFTKLYGKQWDKEMVNLTGIYKALNFPLVKICFEIAVRKVPIVFFIDNDRNETYKTCYYRDQIVQVNKKKFQEMPFTWIKNGNFFNEKLVDGDEFCVLLNKLQSEKNQKEIYKNLEQFLQNAFKNFSKNSENLYHLTQITNKIREILNLDSPKFNEENAFELLCGMHMWNWKYLYFFPIISRFGYPVGGFSCSFINPISSFEYLGLHNFANILFGPLTSLEREIEVGKERDKRQRFALRSAVSAIMARNFSHLWGSNVFEQAKKTSHKEDNLLEYISGRSELIANTTGYLPISWGVGFLKLELEKEKSGILEDRDWKTAISLLEELGKPRISEVIIDLDSKLTDISFGFPYGKDVGKHAFYTMLEGYIRNVQKHAIVNASNKLKIKLDKIDDANDAYVKIKLTSNSKITPKQEEYEEKAKQLLNLINEHYINDDGSQNEEAWGFKEMMICAFLLAGLSIERLDEEEARKKAFTFLYDEARKNGSYSFELILRKVKFIKEFTCERDIDTFIKGDDILPIIKSAVISPNLFKAYADYWNIFPFRIAILKKDVGLFQISCENSEFIKWLKRRIVQLTGIDFRNLMQELLKKLGIYEETIWIKAEDKTIDKKIPEIITGKYKWGIYHHEKKDKEFMKKENKCESWIDIHSEGMMSNIIRRLKNNEMGIEEELKLILGSKILLIDDRLYKACDKDNRITNLKNIGLYVLPEEETEIIGKNNKIVVVSEVIQSSPNLNEYHFISIHLTYLKAKYDSQKEKFPLFNEKNLEKCPPYIFVHTGRGGKLEVIQKFNWLKKVVSYQNLAASLRTKYPLEVKIRLIDSFSF